MPAKYAATITYDGAGSFALAVAVKKADNTTAAVDSGTTTVRSQAELIEAQHTLTAAGYATQMTQYPSNLLQHAQTDALTLAGTL